MEAGVRAGPAPRPPPPHDAGQWGKVRAGRAARSACDAMGTRRCGAARASLPVGAAQPSASGAPARRLPGGAPRSRQASRPAHRPLGQTRRRPARSSPHPARRCRRRRPPAPPGPCGIRRPKAAARRHALPGGRTRPASRLHGAGREPRPEGGCRHPPVPPLPVPASRHVRAHVDVLLPAALHHLPAVVDVEVDRVARPVPADQRPQKRRGQDACPRPLQHHMQARLAAL